MCDFVPGESIENTRGNPASVIDDVPVTIALIKRTVLVQTVDLVVTVVNVNTSGDVLEARNEAAGSSLGGDGGDGGDQGGRGGRKGSASVLRQEAVPFKVLKFSLVELGQGGGFQVNVGGLWLDGRAVPFQNLEFSLVELGQGIRLDLGSLVIGGEGRPSVFRQEAVDFKSKEFSVVELGQIGIGDLVLSRLGGGREGEDLRGEREIGDESLDLHLDLMIAERKCECRVNNYYEK